MNQNLGGRGRKLSQEQIEAEGNRGHRKLRGPGPKLDPMSLEPPELFKHYKCAHELEIWNRLTPIGVAELGWTSADRDQVVLYCETYGQVRRATEELLENGAVLEADRGPIINPAFRVLKDSKPMMMKLATELGLTPFARSKFSIDTTESNPMEARIEQILNDDDPNPSALSQ